MKKQERRKKGCRKLTICQRNEKKSNHGNLSGWHGRANVGTGRARSLPFSEGLCVGCRHGRATSSTGRATIMAFAASIFLPFSHYIRTITYKTKGNNRKQRK